MRHKTQSVKTLRKRYIMNNNTIRCYHHIPAGTFAGGDFAVPSGTFHGGDFAVPSGTFHGGDFAVPSGTFH
jgi:hypothetical protein